MRAPWWLCTALILASCDGGGGVDSPSPAAGDAAAGGRSGVDGATPPTGGAGEPPQGGAPQPPGPSDAALGPDGGPALDAAPPGPPFDCRSLCTLYNESCVAAALLLDCGNCEVMMAAAVEAPNPDPFQRGAALCAEAEALRTCTALAACFADKDGVTTLGDDARVTLAGEVAGVPLALEGRDGWAVVGTKRDGSASDLEVYFEVDGEFWVLDVDDLAQGGPRMDVADHRVRLEGPLTAIRFHAGELQITGDATAAGPLRVEGTLRVDDTAEAITTLQVEVTLRR